MGVKHAAVVAGLVLGSMSGAAKATTVDVSGAFPDSLYSAVLNLDVVNGQAVSGTGTFTGFGLTNASLVLITTSTPYNETSPGPVGFRGNDGTDLGQFDQAYPIDTDGLLFDVGTTTAAFGQFPLFGVANNGDNTYSAIFTGSVNGVEHYAEVTSASVVVGTVPLPASAPMFGAALLALGAVSYGLKRKGKVASAA